MVRVVAIRGFRSVCQLGVAWPLNSALCTASVNCVGARLESYVLLENIGEFSRFCSSGVGSRVRRWPLTNLGLPSKLRRSTITGMMGALIVVRPCPSSPFENGELPTIEYGHVN